MLKSWLQIAGLAGLAAGLPGAALADSTLALTIGGEAYNGPPKFAVSFDGKPVGSSIIDKAIDTATVGRFADAADPSPYIQHFAFTVPDAAFRPDGVVAIQLVNEAHGAAGSGDERALYVQSVDLNGEAVPAMGLAMRSAAGIEPSAMLGDYLVVSQNAVEGIAVPSGGWPAPVIAAAPGAAPAAPPTEAAAAPVPPVTAEAVARVQPAAVTVDDPQGPGTNPNPEAGAADCGLSRSFQVTGFNKNSNDLTLRSQRALDAVIEAIGTQTCVVHLTGYSSTEGDYAHNALFSIERAQNALHYLAGKGVKFRRYSANGVGETTQFGRDPNANRRVVVTVSPG